MKRIMISVFSLSLLVLSLGIVSNPVTIKPAQAAFNGQINYQGKLTNTSNVAVADGDYNMEFNLYTVATLGTAIWTETRTGGDKVTVTNGVFSIMLGSVSSLAGVDFNQPLYLGVNIGGTGSPSWDGEMTPRKPLGSVPAAFVANSLQGTGVIDITNTSAPQASLNYDGSNKLTVGVASNGLTTLTVAGSGAAFNLTGGNVGIGTSSTSAKLHVTATSEQFRTSYDVSNYTSFTTSSGGDLTIAPSGSDLAITGNVDVSGSLTAATANAFTVNTSGAITAATGITSSGTITFSGLGGSGTKCLQTDNSGVVTAAAAACGTGSLTPWTSDIDADGYDLNDLSNVLFRETTGSPAGSDVAVFRDNSGDLTANVLTGKTLNIAVNGTDEYNFSSSTLDLNNNTITNAGSINGLVITANTGVITSGTWQGSVVGGTYGGTGVNNGSNTITLGGNINTASSFTTSGANALTLTTTGATNVTLPTTGTLATLAGVEALSNKTIGNTNTVTLKDTLFTVQDDGDATKLIAFQASGITAGATRTLTVQDASGTLALTSNKLSDFAATTSSELGGVISDETGSGGALVFASSPTISTPTFTTSATTPLLTNAGAISVTTTASNGNIILQANGTGVTVVSSSTANTDTIQLKPQTTGTGAAFNGIITTADLTGSDKTWTLPNVSGTIITTGDTGTVTNTMLAGSIAASKLVGTDIATVGTITSGTWNGTAIADANVADNITISSSGSVDWTALTNYPTACSAGSAVSTLADSPTCTAFNTDTSITLQDAYGATSGNTITTTNSRNLAIVLAEVATPTSFTIENQDTAGGVALQISNTISSGSLSTGLLISDPGNGGSITSAIQISESPGGTITDGILITGTLGNILNSSSIDITGAGAITGATGITSSSTITFSGLGGGGTQCVNVDNSGVLGVTTCGSAFSGEVDDTTNDSLTFTSDDASAPAGTVNSIYRDNTGDLNINTISGKTLNLQIAGSDEYNFSSTALAFNSNNITGLGTGITATAGLTVTSTSANLAFTTATSGNITFAPASTGSVQLTSGVTTGTTTSAGLSLVANSLSSGTGLNISSTSLTSGALLNLDSNGTAAAASQTGLNISLQGTNGTGGITSYGAQISNSHLGGTSTNVALQLAATNGTTANYALITNGGNVGIGDTTPASLFTVGSGDLFQINSTGQIGSQQAPVSDYLFALAGTTGNDNSRIIDITQANDADEDTAAVNIVNTANVGTTSSLTRTIKNISLSLTPTVTATNKRPNIYGIQNNIDLSNTTLGNSSSVEADLVTYGASNTINGTPVINNANASGDLSVHSIYAMNNVINVAPTLTAAAEVYGSYYGNNNVVVVNSTGLANYHPIVYGNFNSVGGDLTTTGNTIHYGGYFAAGGTADTNYGLWVQASGATNNYAAIFNAGNVGIGDATPTAALTVGASDAFQVNSSGAIAAATGVTSSGTITFSGLGGGGTQCVNVNNTGVLGVTTCGGALTPWTSDIDADGYALQDALNLEFRTAAGSAPAGSVIALYADNSGDLTANVLTAKTFNIAVNGTDEYNFSSTALALNSNNITGLGTNLTATAGLTITSTSANLALATSTSGDITATTATTGGIFNVLTGNLKVGAGTPGLTLNGDDAYITGTFEVDGATQFDGGLTFNSTAAFNGVATFNTDVDFTLAGTENLAITNTTGSNAVDLLALTITNNDAGSASQRGLVLTNANSTSTTESLVFLDNADTTASSLTDGILITSSGVNDGITDAIDVSASNITNALNVGANTITGAGYLLTSTASGLTVNSTGANLALTTTTSGNITLAPASTGSVQITSGVTNGTTTTSGLAISANSLTSGTGVYVASSTLSSGSLVDLQVSGTAGASSQKVINAATTGAITGTQTTYGGFFSNTHSGGTSTNIALYATATSGTNNYAAIFDAGNVGIGTTGPDRKLDILDASNPQLRLTTTDGSVYTDFQNTANAMAVVSGSTFASASAQQFGLQITPTINQTSSASYRALDVNVTETGTTVASGLNRLADLRVDSSSKLAVANNGSLLLQNASNIVTPFESVGAFQNLLVRSEEFDNASWTKSSVTAPTANTQVGPDGSTTAESLATSGSGGYVQQATSTAITAVNHTFSVWVRSSTGTQSFDLELDGTTGGTAIVQNHTATTSWQRFSVTGTVSGGTGNVQVRIYPGGTGGTGTVYAAKAQLEISSTANAYALTTGGALTNTGRGESIVSNFATQSGFTYGNRHIVNLEGAISASSTLVGEFIRVNDNATGTDDTATVRGLEVQSYSGSNINGVNTAIAGFGYTFGVHAVTTAQANEAAQPAAVFADLDNGSAPTQGNAIRAYSNDATSADLVSFYQESSAFTGNGLVMNFGNNSGSFSGNFLNLKTAGTTKAHIDSNGYVFASLTSSGTAALCWDGTGGTDERIQDCSGAPVADYAEMYPTTSDAEVGDIMVLGNKIVNTYDINDRGAIDWGKVKGTINQLVKSNGGYQSTAIGVVSDNYGDFSSTGYNLKEEDNPKAIALKGRIPVKVTDENGPIKAGDYITTSNTLSGYGMKATRSGQVVGQALADFNFEEGSTGQVMIFVQVGFQNIGNTIVLDAPTVNGTNLQSGNNNLLTNAASTFVIQQQTSGDEEAESNILQLQTGDANRFMVSSTGATSILSNLTCNDETNECPSVLKVTQANVELVNIDARGNLTLAGTIFIKDDTFAGSIATDENGLAEITFTNHLGTGKPVIQLTPEAQIPVFAQVIEFKQDEHGNYTGFVMKTFDIISRPVRAIVHYNVTGKEEGYITLGEVTVQDQDLEFYAGDGVGTIIEGGEVQDGGTGDGSNGNETGESNDGNIENSGGDSGTVSGDFTSNGSNDNINSEPDSGTDSGL